MTCEEQLKRNIARRRKSQDWPCGVGLSPQKVAEIQAFSSDISVRVNGILERIFKESCIHLRSLSCEVGEGKNVYDASRFVRWLQMSGVLELLEICKDVNPRFVELRKSVTDLIFDCGERFKGGKVDAKYAQSDIAEINRKLDILTSCVAKPVQPIVEIQPACSAARSDGSG